MGAINGASPVIRYNIPCTFVWGRWASCGGGGWSVVLVWIRAERTQRCLLMTGGASRPLTSACTSTSSPNPPATAPRLSTTGTLRVLPRPPKYFLFVVIAFLEGTLQFHQPFNVFFSHSEKYHFFPGAILAVNFEDANKAVSTGALNSRIYAVTGSVSISNFFPSVFSSYSPPSLFPLNKRYVVHLCRTILLSTVTVCAQMTLGDIFLCSAIRGGVSILSNDFFGGGIQTTVNSFRKFYPSLTSSPHKFLFCKNSQKN